jgi:hypothetical protein
MQHDAPLRNCGPAALQHEQMLHFHFPHIIVVVTQLAYGDLLDVHVVSAPSLVHEELTSAVTRR